jgi:hypothetical protein
MKSWSAAVAAMVLGAAPLTRADDAPAPPPSADEIKRVLDYQDNGKERGPALLDLVACMHIDTERGSPTAFTCVEPVTAPVKKGTSVMAWTQWFCPKGGKYEDLTVKYLLEGETRTTIDVKVEGFSRTRSWRAYTVTKPGKWQIKVYRGQTELGQTSFTVIDG